MKLFFVISIFVLNVNFLIFAEDKISKDAYVSTWKQVAIRQMIENKIPASITLAQGILESGCGNSDLAKKGNNHFGIKCSNWVGEKMYINDDSANECFRVYANSEESYNDHSVFLKSKPRYSKLFTLEETDYKSWANELKNAGYATNPKYPTLLIEIIEALKLNELDIVGSSEIKKVIEPKPINNELISLANKHSVLVHINNVKYIVAKKGDTFYRISKEFNLGLWQLYRYNDFDSKKDVLVEGDVIYLQPKRRFTKEKEELINVKSPISLRQVSQQKAIKLEKLIRINHSSNPDEIIAKGEVIHLK